LVAVPSNFPSCCHKNLVTFQCFPLRHRHDLVANRHRAGFPVFNTNREAAAGAAVP